MTNTTAYTELETFTHRELFIKIWRSPRRVFRYMHQRGIDDFVQTLLLLAGIFNAFDRAIEKNLGDSMSLLSVIGFSVFGGALLGWISYYLYAALLSWTGKWIGGRASSATCYYSFGVFNTTNSNLWRSSFSRGFRFNQRKLF